MSMASVKRGSGSKRLTRASLLSTALILGCAQGEARAQEEPQEPQDFSTEAGSAGDIVVTAQRRSELLQKTPIALGVIGADLIEQRNVSQVRDLTGTTPGLFLPKTNSGGVQQIYIRGIGTSAPIYNGAVAMYVDDVYIPRITNSAVFGSADLERIEILRGPQGTLYGQNTSAGAIKIISKEPGRETDGFMTIGFGNYGAFDAKAYISAPIVEDTLAFSLAALRQESDGFVRNLTLGKRVNGTGISQFKGRLKFTPSEAVSILLTGEVVYDKSDNAVGTPVTYPGTRPRVTFDNTDLRQNYKLNAYNMHVNVMISDHINLKSVTGYRRFTNRPSNWSSDGIPGDVSGFQLNLEDESYSQEFQLVGDVGRLNFTFGAIGFHETYEVDRPSWSNMAYVGVSSKTRVNSFALYGQGYYKLTDRLGATFGVRYSWQKDNFDWLRYSSNANLDRVSIVGVANDLVQKTKGWVPKFGLDYQFSSDVFGYASLTKGEKAGGFNAVASTPTIAAVPVEPEKVTAYEVGLKAALFDRKLRANAAVFYNKFNDYHAVVQNPIVGGVQYNVPLITNAAKAETYGFELDATLKASDSLDFRASATILRAKFLTFQNPTGAASTDFSGNVMPRSPKLALNGGFGYVLPLSIPGSLRLSGDVEYVSKTWEDIALSQPVQRYALVSTDLRYKSENDHWTVSLSVRNLLDKEFVITSQRLPASGTHVVTYNAPRTFMLTFRYEL